MNQAGTGPARAASRMAARSGTIGGVPPTIPPDDARGFGSGRRDDRPREPRAGARAPRVPTGGARGTGRPAGGEDADPYGWSTVRAEEPPPAGRLSGGRRQRGPHRRRAADGQQTGLDPRLQSDLPSWLQERGVAQAPISRPLSLSIAGFAALLGFGLLLGAYTAPSSYGIVIFGVQLLFVLAWTATMRPAGPRVVAGVGLATAVAVDLAAVLPDHASLGPLAYVTAAALVASMIAQLARGSRRSGREDAGGDSDPSGPGGRGQVTASLGATVLVVVGVVSFAMLVVLGRHAGGTQATVACLLAAAVALVVARLADVVLPSPRTSTQVPRGSIGVVLGAMAGTVVAGVAGSYLAGLHPSRAAVAGLVTAMVAVMADLAVSYAEAGRRLDGRPPALWIARHLQGPLGGFALAAPAAYILSVMVLISNLG